MHIESMTESLIVIFYMVASILGGAISAALFGQNGLLAALLAAPFGGSLSALLASSLLVSRRASGHGWDAVPREIVWC